MKAEPPSPYRPIIGVSNKFSVWLWAVIATRVLVSINTAMTVLYIMFMGYGQAVNIFVVTERVLVGINLIAFIVTAVFFVKWMYRTHINSQLLADSSTEVTEAMEASARKAVTPWFIPILNLYRPYQEMKKLWVATKFDGESGTTNIGLWWFCWLGSGIVDASIRFAFNNLIALLLCIFLGTVLRIACAVLIYKIVRAMTNAQWDAINAQTANAVK
jgi:hypothetical protein